MRFSVVTPLWQDRPPAENLEVAITADRLGFPELWVGEMATYDAFALATAIGLRTRSIRLNIGPLAVPVRTPMTIAMGVASVADLTGRRTAVALGSSSEVVVEAWHGRSRQATARQLAESARILQTLLAGAKADFAGDTASCRGYRLRLDAPGPAITIAAFGPAAVRVAARHSERMLLNMVTPGSLARLRQQLEQAARDCDRPVPRVAVWLPCATDQGDAATQQFLRAAVGYLAAPGYGEMMIEAGFGELVRLARRRPHPRELLAATPPELAGAVGLLGSETDIERRVAAYRAAGADEICLVPATAGDPGGRRTLEVMRTYLPGSSAAGPA